MGESLAEALQAEVSTGFLKELSVPPQTEKTPAITSWADIDSLIGPIHFDWYPWLPSGLLTILASDAGEGKSALALRLAGCFVSGLPWPDGTPFEGECESVLWAEAEAAQAVNLARAKEWGLPLNRFVTPFDDPLLDLNLDNKAHMAALTSKAQLPEVKFIVVDSLSGSSSRKESETEIKQATEFLARLARDTGKSVLLTHHLRKRGFLDGENVTLDRLRGSSAIVQAARVVWAIDRPNPGSDRKRLSMVKSNITKLSNPIGFEIRESEMVFGDAPHAPRVETQVDKAADLLLALLKSGPQKAITIEDEVTQAGLSMRSAKEAKRMLNIVSTRKDGVWYWGLPYEKNMYS